MRFLIAFALAVVGTGWQAPTFSTRVEAVRVEVLVTLRGKPVPGLRREEFQVTDNGVPQTIDLLETGELPLNLILAYDLSESVIGERRSELQSASAALLSGLRRGDRAALITFNESVSLRCRLSAEPGCIASAIEGLTEIGQTALVDGIFTALAVAEADLGRSLIVVFTDGLDTASWMDPARLIEAGKRADVVLYAVAVDGSRPPLLDDLVEATGGTLFEVERNTNLAAVFSRILDEFRHRYVLSYTPRNVSRAGWHTLQVKVARKDVRVKARPGYLSGGS